MVEPINSQFILMINAPWSGQRFWDIKFLEASSVESALALAREVAFNVMRSSPHSPEEFKFELFHSDSILPQKVNWSKEFADEKQREDDAEATVARFTLGPFPSE